MCDDGRTRREGGKIMSAARTKRRRVRNTPPNVLEAIHQALLTGASAPEVARALEGRDDLPADSIPSVRTISNIARDMDGADDGEAWRVDAADPATVALVLSVLMEVVRRTEGRVGSLTRAQASVIPVIHAAMQPHWSKLPARGQAWQTYVLARFYLSWVRTDQDAQDAALFLAAPQGPGKWPMNRWMQVDRVIRAAAGWLPIDVVKIKA